MSLLEFIVGRSEFTNAVHQYPIIQILSMLNVRCPFTSPITDVKTVLANQELAVAGTKISGVLTPINPHKKFHRKVHYFQNSSASSSPSATFSSFAGFSQRTAICHEPRKASSSERAAGEVQKAQS